MIYPFFYDNYKYILNKYKDIDMSSDIPKQLHRDLEWCFNYYMIKFNIPPQEYWLNILCDLNETYDRMDALKDIEKLFNNN